MHTLSDKIINKRSMLVECRRDERQRLPHFLDSSPIFPYTLEKPWFVSPLICNLATVDALDRSHHSGIWIMGFNSHDASPNGWVMDAFGCHVWAQSAARSRARSESEPGLGSCFNLQCEVSWHFYPKWRPSWHARNVTLLARTPPCGVSSPLCWGRWVSLSNGRSPSRWCLLNSCLLHLGFKDFPVR